MYEPALFRPKKHPHTRSDLIYTQILWSRHCLSTLHMRKLRLIGVEPLPEDLIFHQVINLSLNPGLTLLPHNLPLYIPVVVFLLEISEKGSVPWCFINIIKLDLIHNYNSCLVMMTIISLATLLVKPLLGGTSHLISQDLWKNYKHFTFAKNQRNVTYSSMFFQSAGWGSTTTVITRPSFLCILKTGFKSLYPKSNKTSFSFNFDSAWGRIWPPYLSGVLTITTAAVSGI